MVRFRMDPSATHWGVLDDAAVSPTSVVAVDAPATRDPAIQVHIRRTGTMGMYRSCQLGSRHEFGETDVV